MLSDLAIAQQATLQRICDLARERWGLPPEHLEPYGHHKAKITREGLAALQGRADGKLVIVTAISPTPAGEGKTTTTVGLGDALHRIGRRAVICLREPSMGPVFGMKGGAAGGGHAQVVPMEDINLHFTGDFAAVAASHNLLAALIDNHIHHGNELGLDVRRIVWRRAVDMNDRALRSITVGLGGPANGYPREDGFDIVAASEVMAILCLCRDLPDLRERLGRIVAAYTRDGQPVTAKQLKAHGAMAALLKQAVLPTLVQTLEGNPALIHGGPFANIAHGCNSVIATRVALKLGEFAVTEAGFGADLGAEKFIDIKCRSAGLKPDAAVLVATLRALKFHGGVDAKALDAVDPAAVGRGLVNLERHLRNLREVFGLPCAVALNHFSHDTADEIAVLQRRCAELDVPLAVCRHWEEGGAGAIDLAHEVVRLCQRPSAAVPLYGDELPLWDKIHAVATRLYGAANIAAGPAVRRQIQALQDGGQGALPVCVAKTPYSFSTDPALRGAPGGHVLDIRAVRLAAGAGFVVVICGDIMTMPGLSRHPAAHAIDIDADGRIVGLF